MLRYSRSKNIHSANNTQLHKDFVNLLRANSSTRERLLLTNVMGDANSRVLVSSMELVRDTFSVLIEYNASHRETQTTNK